MLSGQTKIEIKNKLKIEKEKIEKEKIEKENQKKIDLILEAYNTNNREEVKNIITKRHKENLIKQFI